MKFENRRGANREKIKIKNRLVNWKAYFFSCYFFIIPFSLHFKDDF
jgi:hypothetical protein